MNEYLWIVSNILRYENVKLDISDDVCSKNFTVKLMLLPWACVKME